MHKFEVAGFIELVTSNLLNNCVICVFYNIPYSVLLINLYQFSFVFSTCSVEKCECPEGYYGYSCEDCDIGYYRSQEGPLGPFCTKCDCSGHADTCHPETGECVNLVPPPEIEIVIEVGDPQGLHHYCHFHPEKCTIDDKEVRPIILTSQRLKITEKSFNLKLLMNDCVTQQVLTKISSSQKTKKNHETLFTF